MGSTPEFSREQFEAQKHHVRVLEPVPPASTTGLQVEFELWQSMSVDPVRRNRDRDVTRVLEKVREQEARAKRRQLGRDQ